MRELIESDLPVAYADLVLMLCSVISACAARRWPGRGIDQRRFVELLAVESPSESRAAWISVPSMIVDEHFNESETQYGEPGQADRIFCDDEIDLSFEAARQAYPHVAARDLKRCSYAFLIYDWLRCGYAHQYCPHENITHVPPSRRDARLSYILRGSQRMICFHLDYLVALAEHHANSLTDEEAERPERWWLDID